MLLTKESEYALQGLAMLVDVPLGEVRALSRIAEDQGLPASFLAKIFQKLARQGLLSAARGPGSGYALARPAASINVREILETVEGPEIFQHCFLWPGHDDGNPCTLHAHVEPILMSLAAQLESITLEQYAASLDGDSVPSKNHR